MSDTIDDVYSGSTIAAADLRGKNVIVTITGASKREFDGAQGKVMKIVLTLKETEKEFVVNKTNANRIAESHGRRYPAWVGKKITLTPDRTEYQGKIVDCIRVAFPTAHESENPASFADLDDEIPF